MPKWFGGCALNPDEIVEPKNQWQFQYHRLRRWYECVLTLKTKCETKPLSEYDLDTIIAFFQNCYHLRDWLKTARPELKNAIKALFDTNFEMRACRDICNGFKHKKLTNPSVDADFNIVRTYDYFLIKSDPRKNPESYHIAFADGKNLREFNVFDLAEKCVGIWEDLLLKNGLAQYE